VAALPTGEPLVGRTVRLDVLTEADLPELYPSLADSEVYAAGYVMHRRPSSLDDAVALARERFLPPGAPDGRGGGGRTPYAVRLVADTGLGPAGTLVGTSALMEAHAAIARLGAHREGVLRRDQRREDGTFRDTVVFSVLIDEWPEVTAGLLARLKR
jgi:hypothetical protein